jgi:hypothetical protein
LGIVAAVVIFGIIGWIAERHRPKNEVAVAPKQTEPLPSTPPVANMRPQTATRRSPIKSRSPNTSAVGTIVGSVVVQSGGVASFGQQGGQTAGTIINNPIDAPELSVRTMYNNQLTADLYESKYYITIKSQFTIGRFAALVRSSSQSMTSVSLQPVSMGRDYSKEVIPINGQTGYVAIISMVGDAMLVMKTKVPETQFYMGFECMPVKCDVKQQVADPPPSVEQSPK